jgi:hypothetical protein
MTRANKKFKTLQAAYAAAPAGTAAEAHRHRHQARCLLPARRPSAPQPQHHQELHHPARPHRRSPQGRARRQSRQQGRRHQQRLHPGHQCRRLLHDQPHRRELLQPRLRVSRQSLEEPQDALAGHHAGRRIQTQGDKHIYSHVAIPQPARHHVHPHHALLFHQRLHVEGTDDFLGGGQVGVFQDSEIYFPTGNGVMSASGITFINTVFKAAPGTRVLQRAFAIRTRSSTAPCRSTHPQSPVAWMVMEGLPCVRTSTRSPIT